MCMCVCETERDLVLWGHLRMKREGNKKKNFIIMIFIFPYTWTTKRKSVLVLDVSHFCEITISSQIRNLTDDGLLQKQYVSEAICTGATVSLWIVETISDIFPVLKNGLGLLSY